jgi:hypothetical protein
MTTPTPAATAADMSVPYLDTLVALGRYIEFYDPAAARFGLPTYPYRWAPTDLATLRQLRAANLRPGGQEIAAQILWRHKGKQRVAYLYRISQAKAKRTATPAQRAAIDRALIARMRCPTCRIVRGYYIPRRYGECLDCAGVI